MVVRLVTKSVERLTGRSAIFHSPEEGYYVYRYRPNSEWTRLDILSNQYFFDDEDVRRLRYERASTVTGTQQEFYGSLRACSLQQMLEFVLERGVPGDVVELGCFRGRSSLIIAEMLKDANFDATFHIFDSFEGIAATTDDDSGRSDGTVDEPRPGEFRSARSTVEAALEEFDFVEIHEGWIPERFPDVAERTFSFVHVDVDLNQATLDSVSFFYPRLSDGGVMVFDDYGSARFQGASKAIDELVADHPECFFFPLPSTGAWLVKRW